MKRRENSKPGRIVWEERKEEEISKSIGQHDDYSKSTSLQRNYQY